MPPTPKISLSTAVIVWVRKKNKIKETEAITINTNQVNNNNKIEENFPIRIGNEFVNNQNENWFLILSIFLNY